MSLIFYAAIQLAAMSVDYVAFLLLIEFEVLSPLFANAVGKCVGVMVAFNGHRHFTFRETAKRSEASGTKTQLLKYWSMLPINIFVSSLLLSSIIWLGFTPIIAKIGSDFITFFLFFGASKYLVFK